MMGLFKSFDSERKMSRMKDEKLVKEPQKPVARPMYMGIVFLTLPCRGLSRVWSAG